MTSLSTSRDVFLRIGPYAAHVQTAERPVLRAIELLYEGHVLPRRPAFCEFHVSIARPGLRRFVRPKVEFSSDGVPLAKPAPPHHGPTLLEWGLNWLIATGANEYLVIHAAVLERKGRAMVLPGEPGAGKSTLAAALAHRGWRLLSDELALVVPSTGELVGLARPVSLKNESIGVIGAFAPESRLSEAIHGTPKGTIALMKPPQDSVARVSEKAAPGLVVLPRYVPDSGCVLEPCAPARSFMSLADNALNYSVLGYEGFRTVGRIVGSSRAFELRYDNLHEATVRLAALADDFAG